MKIAHLVQFNSWRNAMGTLMLVALVAVSAGLAVGIFVMILLYTNKSDECGSAPRMNVCWKPLLELSRGFPFSQQHVAPFLQAATDATLTMNVLPTMSSVPAGAYDYPSEVITLVAKMATVTTQTQIDEVIFFDGKVNIALGILVTMMLGYGQSIDEMLWHTFGETSAVHDSGVAVWKNKLLNSRIRPTTVIQELYPEESFVINNGIEVFGKHFQALVRVMPHSEYPSGSSCVCQAIDEYLTALWPELELVQAGVPVAFDVSTTPVVLTNSFMTHIPITGVANPSTSGYTAATLNTRCGETRLEGGMHFTPAVPAGRALCAGMGSATAAQTKKLLPGVTEGTATARAAIGATSPCEATCCANATECGTAEQLACAAGCTGVWDMPWFDVVDARMQVFGLENRTTATTTVAPYFQVDRNHIGVLGIFSALVPEILKTETIFQFRVTNTVDNILWNSVAANSANILAMHFGQSHEPQEPTIRSGQTTTDARIVTAIHALAASLPLLLPASQGDFEASLSYALLSPTIGFENSLTTACGAPEAHATVFNSSCLVMWYDAQAPSPAALGQTIAYELMYFKVRDGWNSIGTDDGCDAGSHFCLNYADVTSYDPESGACLDESLD